MGCWPGRSQLPHFLPCTCRRRLQAAIVVVDDSIDVRRFFTLEKAGYRVEQAKDGLEALEKLEGLAEVKAVVCDIEMPRLDGFGFLAQARARDRGKHIPIIMLTSRSGSKHRDLALRLGASAYCTKPFKEQELLRALSPISPRYPCPKPMAVPSALRARRARRADSSTTEQFIAFHLRAAWFVLPVAAAYGVVPVEDELPALAFGGTALPVVRAASLLFGDRPPDTREWLYTGHTPVAAIPAAVVVLPIDSQPSLQRLRDRDFVPLPPTYRERWHADFVTAMTLPAARRPSLFAIDPDRLVAFAISQAALSG